MTDLSVLIATHNGERVLPRTLQGYVDVAGGETGWKIIVVDNASTDATPDIIASFQRQLPLVGLTAPEPGKNRALNTGLSEIEGDLIVVSDDDSIPQPGFLPAWRRAFDAMAEFDVFGGSIHLEFDAPPPDWLLERELKFEELYAIRKNVPAGPIHPLKIYGPNMAVRRRVFDQGMAFNPAIGPNGADKNYAMGSENDFCTRAAARGHATGFAPEPLVHHIVRPHQMTPDYWAKRAYKLGRGAAQQQWDAGKIGVRSRPAPARLAAAAWRKLRRAQLGLSAATATSDLARFQTRWAHQFYCGFHDEHARRKAAARSAPATAGAQRFANP